MKKSTLLHLRIPFSFFLLPVFLLAAATVPVIDWPRFLLVFFILHFLLYPASNGYNSYFDKDKHSIGGLKHPPRVSGELFRVSLVLDILALALGLMISLEFAAMLLVYGLVSKAYSHPSVRLKKMPIIGWLAAGVFQGYFTVLMACLGLADLTLSDLAEGRIQLAGVCSTLLLFGSYPMTQVYQHEEDSERGDRTISIVLGVPGTFHFTGVCFVFSVSVFVWYFLAFYDGLTALFFVISLLPVLVFFVRWYWQVRKDPGQADFVRTMRLNLLSGVGLNIFFGWMIWVS